MEQAGKKWQKKSIVVISVLSRCRHLTLTMVVYVLGSMPVKIQLVRRILYTKCLLNLCQRKQMAKKIKKRYHASKACKYIQLYVRLLETDANGYGKCCSCDLLLTWEEGQGGHFQPKGRNYNAAAFTIENLHLQCSSCNLYKGGNPAGYMQFMANNYSKETIEKIKQLSYETLDCNQIDDIAREYKQKCIKLDKTKNFKVNII